MKTVHAYTYVGPEEIRRAVASHPVGTPLSSREVLEDWLRTHPEAREEGATYTVELQGRMRLAPRRSEHVACAGGEEVLAAGEIRFQGTGTRLGVAEVSNQSTGYCPDTTCWEAVAGALEHLGVVRPPGFTHAVLFRRCPRCGERNLVKEGWFVCVFCDAELPAEWNVAPRREVRVGAPEEAPGQSSSRSGPARQ